MSLPCNFCLGVQHGNRFTCPRCGRGLIHYLPLRAEIYEHAAKIRGDWSASRLRACEGYEEAAVTLARRVSDGMRRRDKEDGRET